MDADGADLTGSALAHYEVAERIGLGGMGEVYRARDTRLDRDVAIKVLPPDAARDPGRRRRFESEAKAVAALKHPNIVTIHSVEEADGIRFLTMELVEGATLSRELTGTGLPIGRFLEIAVPLADAVAFAHGKGIVHRDLKPSNVMLDADGRLKVLDFGLAKLWAETPDDAEATLAAAAELTRTGTAVGTPAYMAPEQIAGRGAGARSDVFSLGILFHQMLAGEHPFAADYPAAAMVRIVNDEPPPLTGVPDAVAAVVARCLRKDPDARFADGGELRVALGALAEAAAAGTPTAAAVPTATVDSRIADALKRGAWEEANEALHALAKDRDLVGEELEVLAETEVWLSRYDEYLRTLERAHTLYVARGRSVAAARVALELNENYANLDPKPALARGWLRRAERLLADQPECLEHGRLARRWFVDAIGKCDLERAEETNRRCAEIAERAGNADLRIIALHDRGRILIARGETEEGAALVDEAMAAAMAGEVSPMTVGTLFCRTLWVCKAVADYDRALEWTEAATRWSEAHAVSSFPGICRVHSAETLRRHGRWGDAERAVRAACDFFAEVGPDAHAGEAFNELGELALRKGDLEEADGAFHRAHEYGYDPVPGLPLLRLAQGKTGAALQMIDRALGECPGDRLRRASLLSARVEVALALGRTETAEADAGELASIAEDYRCPAFRASAAMAAGAVRLGKGEASAAVAPLRDAWSGFHGGGFAHDAARVRVLLARAYREAGAEEDARLELDAAAKTFAELGARIDVEVVEKLIAAGP